MEKHFTLNHILLLILIALCGHATFQLNTTPFGFSLKQYIGIILVAITSILALINKKWFIYMLGITLFCGAVTVAAFSIYVTTQTIGVNEIGVRFQPLPAILLVAYLIINTSNLIPNAPKQKIASSEEIASNRESRINNFEEKFKDLSQFEIQKRLKSKLVSEAREALKRILLKKNQ